MRRTAVDMTFVPGHSAVIRTLVARRAKSGASLLHLNALPRPPAGMGLAWHANKRGRPCYPRCPSDQLVGGRTLLPAAQLPRPAALGPVHLYRSGVSRTICSVCAWRAMRWLCAGNGRRHSCRSGDLAVPRRCGRPLKAARGRQRPEAPLEAPGVVQTRQERGTGPP